MSEEFPTMVKNKKDVLCMMEFIITVLYFRGFINLKTYDGERKKVFRKWNLKSTQKEGTHGNQTV